MAGYEKLHPQTRTDPSTTHPQQERQNPASTGNGPSSPGRALYPARVLGVASRPPETLGGLAGVDPSRATG